MSFNKMFMFLKRSVVSYLKKRPGRFDDPMYHHPIKFDLATLKMFLPAFLKWLAFVTLWFVFQKAMGPDFFKGQRNDTENKVSVDNAQSTGPHIPENKKGGNE